MLLWRWRLLVLVLRVLLVVRVLLLVVLLLIVHVLLLLLLRERLPLPSSLLPPCSARLLLLLRPLPLLVLCDAAQRLQHAHLQLLCNGLMV